MKIFILFVSFLGVYCSNHSLKYDENEARILLNLAAAAYGSQHEQCLNQTFKEHNKYYKITENTKAVCDSIGTVCESFVVVSQHHRIVYIIFSGTKSTFQLLLEGIDRWKSSPFLGMGLVNTYFLKAHQVLWPDLELILNSSRYINYNVIFTGHSLGGALASLAIAKTVRQGYRSNENVKLVTFGQPRVGDFDFAKNFDLIVSNSFRIVNRKDVVPHIPRCFKNLTIYNQLYPKPCEFNSSSKRYHHGTEIWYPQKMPKESTDQQFYTECHGWPRNEDLQCSDSLRFYYSKINEYIWDHRHYFGIRVPDFGKSGCDGNYPEGRRNFS